MPISTPANDRASLPLISAVRRIFLVLLLFFSFCMAVNPVFSETAHASGILDRVKSGGLDQIGENTYRQSDDPISEIFERQPLPPYQEGDFTTPTAHRTGSHPHGLAGPAPSASDSSSPPASPAELPFAEEAEDGPPPHHSPRHPS